MTTTIIHLRNICSKDLKARPFDFLE